MTDATVVRGSCLCGAIELSAKLDNKKIAACHCNMCRKWGGGALLALECGGDVSFANPKNISIYQSSEWAERGFCQQCGTHLFYRLKQDGRYFMPAGIFDRLEGFIFESQIFIDEKPDYYCFANETTNLTGAELFAQFALPSE
jgi:hypothetical protein